jgi:metal transporter CNNM
MEITNTLTWLLIVLCITQSALFSGMNIAVFSISRLWLEVEASTGNTNAQRILSLRTDSNFILTTILWGNVGVNVLLTLLSGSILTGLVAFIFSTFVITFFGEIMPQAYSSRHALKTASLFYSLLRFYQLVLFPIAKPTAKMLDAWLGKEGANYMREKELREMLMRHVEAPGAEIDQAEGLGALNFLAIDDLTVIEEGETVDPESIIMLPFKDDIPIFPEYTRSEQDPFLRQLQKSGKKWVIITNENGIPQFALNSDAFLRNLIYSDYDIDPMRYCHRPVVIEDSETLLGQVLPLLRLHNTTGAVGEYDRDIVLVWTDDKRLITGTDILDRLLQGITK